ncbi:MAG: hypothetical protein KTR31_11540 [Myxococcales bacterium]|nr:hypothetical protein [Myxococcales bacterium]
MGLSVCVQCGHHVPPRTCWCPECGTKVGHCSTNKTAAALMLGLLAATPGCMDKGSTCVDYGGCDTTYDTDADTDVDTDTDTDTDADTDPTGATGDTGPS